MKFGDLFKSRRNIQITVIIIFVLLLAGSVWQYRNFVNQRIAQLEEEYLMDGYEDLRFNDLLDIDSSLKLIDENVDATTEKSQPVKEVSSAGDNGVKEAESKKAVTNKDTSKTSQTASAKTTTSTKEMKMDTMVIPVFGTVSAGYSDSALVYSKTLDQWSTHVGVDIKAEEGSQVRAAMDGVVKEVKNDGQWGLTIIIDHGSGITTKYSNLSTLDLVSVGQTVKKGDVISGIGKTALCEIVEEPHLHFEVLKDGKNINPEQYLPKQSFKK